MASAGMIRSASTILIAFDGLPSIKILTFSFPRKLTFPSTSTDTEGIFESTSLTVPPFTIKSFPTLNTFLSSLISTVVFSARTTTSFNCAASSNSAIVPKFVLLCIDFDLISVGLNEINSIEIA